MYGYGESLGTAFSDGIKAGTTSSGMNLEDPNTFNLGNMAAAIADPNTLIKAEQERKQVTDVQQAEKKKQDAIAETTKKAFSDLQSLDQKTKATMDSIAYSAMTNAQKIQYEFELATHNTIANFYAMEEAAKASMSRMSDMLSAMGINLPGVTYSPGEMLNQRSETLQKLNAQRNALTQAGPAAFGGDLSAYRNAIKDIDNQIKQLKSNSVVSSIAKSGQSVGSAWSSGVASGITSGASGINNAVGFSSSSLRANSPPIDGPLMNVDKDGLNIGSIFAENISKGLTGAKGIINTGLSSIGLTNVPRMQPATNQTSTTHITVDMAGANINSELDATTVGKRVGEGLANKLIDQAGRAGFSIPNQIR
jgi:hypothetical protein